MLKKLLVAFVFLACFSFAGCFGLPERPHSDYTVIDFDRIPMQLVETQSKVQVEGKFVDLATNQSTVKTITITDYQGWYMINPTTFRKLVLSGMAPKGKVIILSPESDPFAITDTNSTNTGVIMVRMIGIEDGKEIVKGVKIADYIKWVVVHPNTYRRLIQTALPSK